MKPALALFAAAALAGCASAPPKERLEVRHLAPGEPVFPGLVCVSFESGTPYRIVLQNERDADRAIIWFPRWRTKDGYVLKGGEDRVHELVVPAGGKAAIVAQPPAAEATQFEVLVGDRPEGGEGK